ncbi:MAG: hypothetical protein QOD00_733 [Blastocatellia bacterium]|jgi:uncharacterized BrkB/YihY/UPF0761 family membrane protein|nr:hypothetical protein [Blastocatellia bacterium]
MENISNASPHGHVSFLSRRITSWASLLLITLAGLAVVIIPVMLIQPFRPQSPRDLEISYALRRWSPLLTILFSLAALVLTLRLWPASRRWWRKSALVLLMVLSLTATWFARQNHFEWMFNPLAHTAYARADEAGFLQDADMLMAVKINGEAAAYPIRQMAYHHLVQDSVGGTHIVATY